MSLIYKYILRLYLFRWCVRLWPLCKMFQEKERYCAGIKFFICWRCHMFKSRGEILFFYGLMDSSPLSLIKEGITFLTFSYLVIIIILFFFPPQTTTNNLPTNVSFHLLYHDPTQNPLCFPTKSNQDCNTTWWGVPGCGKNNQYSKTIKEISYLHSKY